MVDELITQHIRSREFSAAANVAQMLDNPGQRKASRSQIVWEMSLDDPIGAIELARTYEEIVERDDSLNQVALRQISQRELVMAAETIDEISNPVIRKVAQNILNEARPIELQKMTDFNIYSTTLRNQPITVRCDRLLSRLAQDARLLTFDEYKEHVDEVRAVINSYPQTLSTHRSIAMLRLVGVLLAAGEHDRASSLIYVEDEQAIKNVMIRLKADWANPVGVSISLLMPEQHDHALSWNRSTRSPAHDLATG